MPQGVNDDPEWNIHVASIIIYNTDSKEEEK